ncbi:SWIM zinc finger family protein [Pectinatus haikarae]|uniref:SWIM-type domain-containing protein n=1 Tax=Pectinatus haikarae TaxID=349096 RepID=A0ABT9YAY9_9FIRM|nr:SWIM zinc finger family protein [Pectinatus haikarae]MDQ0205000.1 hypothetical protein [Pectinatus haikarae]
MNLKNFDKQIEPVILKRGKAYYLEGRVQSLTETENNYYTAVVKGTDTYRVHAHIDRSIYIENITCDCPYTYAPYCKHIAAVLYALRDRLQTGQEDNKFLVPAQNDAPVSDKYDDKKTWINLMRENIRDAKGRDNFIKWNECFSALKGTYKVLERIEIAIDCKDFLLAADLILSVINEMLKMTQFTDDSDGGITDILENAKALLTINIQSVKDKRERKLLFNKILTESKKKIYDGWPDERIALLKSCIDLADSPRQGHTVETNLFMQTCQSEEPDIFNKYVYEKELLLKYQLLQKFDMKNTDSFLKENKAFAEIREILFNKLLCAKKYDEAESLVLEGEKSDAKFLGLVIKWKQLRFKIYETEKITAKMRLLAYELLIEYDCFEYYSKLKLLYAQKEWQKKYVQIIAEIEKRGYAGQTYCQIVIQENDWQSLLKYTKHFPYRIIDYHKYLLKIYPREVHAIFMDFIMQSAASSIGRSDYKKLCRYLQMLCKADGRDTASLIKKQLSLKYPRRKALLEELENLSSI